MIEFIKFFIIGILNTVIDFTALNLLILFFGIGTNGEFYILLKSASFLIAVANSYFFNKYWVFRNGGDPHVKESFFFFTVSFIGFLLNVSISYFAFLSINAVYAVSPHLAANIGAIAGTGAVVLWNFIGYKFFVFSKKHE
ncbi:MAG: GtrA family protein [bacterium]|nr:GtrA family protein [bacterium]